LLCRLVDVLNLPTVLVPPNPGNVSAFGLLTVDVKNDYVQTHVALHDALDPVGVQAGYDALAGQARAALTKEGFPEEQHRFLRTADLRYFGQAFEVRVAVPEGDLDQAALDGVAARFHAEHTALYGYDFADDDDQQVEWVNVRVSGIGPIQRPEIKKLRKRKKALVAKGRRDVCFEASDGYVDTPVYWRADLPPGTAVEGPAIIEEFGSTVPLHPGFHAVVDNYLNIIVTRSAPEESK
jgi:N-methylhydantoinase A